MCKIGPKVNDTSVQTICSLFRKGTEVAVRHSSCQEKRITAVLAAEVNPISCTF